MCVCCTTCYTIVRLYSVFSKELEKVDKENGGVDMAWIDERYGEGAAKFIEEALKFYVENNNK